MPNFTLRPTFSIGGYAYPIYDRDIPDLWHGFAEEKGFEITARVRDKNHLVLRHEICGLEMVTKIFVLRTCVPACPHCLEMERRELCRAADVTYLGRGDRSHYLRIRLACGHETERQTELLHRVRQEQTAIRCAQCLNERLKREAAAREWSLIGDDPHGNLNYRLYRHDCGHVQRVAIANMRTGRFACGGCSDGWTRDPSYIYAMRFVLQDGTDAIKVGFSRDPHSRLRFQLTTERDQYAMLLRTIEIPTGRDAIRMEKDLHLTLRKLYPNAVLDRRVFASQVNCVSELYDSAIEAEIMSLLDALEVRVKGLVARRAKAAKAAADADRKTEPGTRSKRKSRKQRRGRFRPRGKMRR
ncbi:GIY-YIG nuclease family protein [Paracoccus sp. TK19116]|uniref:GIY-YIG nuclease family protein n=1 Tax=Paracoccus albicereus TaxID=2922394 RepID=A0ABT1MUW2_9RHOB|nr:GIY-YIG nuclease family protein [Paracoccus albicereus]MCQ0971996.1 GIY-YIG nuclease family protein [Paracoccus albicereus]